MNAPDLHAIQRTAIDGAVFLPVELVRPSPTNPRKHFDQQHLQELADSLAKVGQISPIVVRPIAAAKAGEPLYEIVAGERRWRACKLASLGQVMALVRELTDFEVLELQVIENLQRDDLHPLEEAEGYAALLRKPDGVHGYANAEELAARIGKSRRYVYNRLKLLDLVPAATTACLNGKLSASVALLIARLQPSDQAEALKICVDGWGGDPLTARSAAVELERRFMLKLSAAPFKITDASLLPDAGSCRECPKRTGANPDLFDDIKSADTCTDAKCFNAKTDAHRARVLEEGKAKGLEVITGAAAKKVMPSQYGNLKGYLKLDDADYRLSDKPLRKLLGKDAPETVLLEDPHTHDVVEVVRETEAVAVLKAKGVIKQAKVPSTNANQRSAEAKAKAATAWRTAAAEQVMAGVLAVEGDAAAQLAAFMWPEVALVMWNRLSSDDERRCEKLLGWEHIASAWQDPKSGAKTEARIRALTMPELGRLITCMCLVGEMYVSPNTTPKGMVDAPRIGRFAQQLGIDVAKIRRDLAAGVGGKQPAAKKAAKAKDATAAFVEAHAGAVRPAAAPKGTKYWNAETGETWTGKGKQPLWLRNAIADGETLEAFLVEPKGDAGKTTVNPDALRTDVAAEAEA